MILQPVDRTRQPQIRRIDKLNIQPAEKLRLRNGLETYIINQGVQDVCGIELIFKAGKWHQDRKLVARFTNLMLREGTKNYSSKELSERMDYYGAFLRTQSGADSASVSVAALNKYLPEVVPVFAEVVRQPVFPMAELEIALTRNRQRLKVNKTKNDYVADRAIAKMIFGTDHPYGSEQEDADYDGLSPDVLKKFYSSRYLANNCYMLVSGKVNQDTVSLLEKYFGDKEWEQTVIAELEKKEASFSELKQHIKMPNSVQASIRIGKRLFNKTHVDFQKMQILNTLLGGYFGSRLMSNIREEKGFTYGIHSDLPSMLHAGYFFISTEVGVEIAQEALKEIYKEVTRIREELIPDAELDLVRNYLSGKILAGLDGPFRLAEYYKGLIPYGLDIEYVHRLLDTIKTITSSELRQLAEKYLNTEEMHEVVVG